MRQKAKNSSSMQYLNVMLTGLRGKKHPALEGIVSAHEVKKSRIHIKMLAGDYLTLERKSSRLGGSPFCTACQETPLKIESLKHILIECVGYRETRQRIFLEYNEVCKLTKSKINFEEICKNDENLTQFILNPTSFNLNRRVHTNDPALNSVFKISRDFCFAINSTRMKNISEKKT